mmetsp:Transcript_11199/g.16034  ORF Transcript_11199/g.16034 Transcript_11199/m.16034 type:complete len:110 (-) Transcript_11199:744-1073(-)
MNLEGQFMAVVIIIAISGLIIMEDLLGGMIQGVTTAVVMIKIMMMIAADRHPIVIIVEMIEGIMIEIMIEEMIAEGEEVVATVDAAVKDGVEADPFREVAVAHRLAHVM